MLLGGATQLQALPCGCWSWRGYWRPSPPRPRWSSSLALVLTDDGRQRRRRDKGGGQANVVSTVAWKSSVSYPAEALTSTWSKRSPRWHARTVGAPSGGAGDIVPSLETRTPLVLEVPTPSTTGTANVVTGNPGRGAVADPSFHPPSIRVAAANRLASLFPGLPQAVASVCSMSRRTWLRGRT
jgi:hypothetical protein